VNDDGVPSFDNTDFTSFVSWSANGARLALVVTYRSLVSCLSYHGSSASSLLPREVWPRPVLFDEPAHFCRQRAGVAFSVHSSLEP